MPICIVAFSMWHIRLKSQAISVQMNNMSDEVVQATNTPDKANPSSTVGIHKRSFQDHVEYP
jgi:hypothetical protein